jgi:DedD protein
MMDRRVKERLVGATILVALIVLVVPELLSGPKPSSTPPLEQGLPSATREVQVDLATSKATPEPQQPASAASGAAPAVNQVGRSGPDASQGGQAQDSTRPASEGALGSTAPSASGNEPSPPTVATLRAQESQAPLETAPPPPKSTSGAPRSAPGDTGSQRRSVWAVQLGSFASKANAEKLAHQLQSSAASAVYVVSSGSGSAARYRVRMGPLADRSAAERAIVKLRAQGHSATIVTPNS